MSKLVSLIAANGRHIEFHDELKAKGGMKDVYFSPDRRYVVAFYRSAPSDELRDRLTTITGQYRDRIMNQSGADYWSDVFCWPETTVEYQGRIGVVVPFYGDEFFFKFGSRNEDMLSLRSREKESKWFTSPSNRNRFLDERELGDWLSQVKICINVSRAVRRLHSAGLAHSDLSYKNILVDPLTGKACIIDIDGLVVPGKYPPEVVGTPDFIAPECVKTSQLPKSDPNKKLPSISTDEHALATFIYLLLFCRHPLRGRKVHNQEDPQIDEIESMGKAALFIEHPTDPSNRVNVDELKSSELPWMDTSRLPYSIAGPYLSGLFHRAFVDGLHSPKLRPSADEFEQALYKTVDLLHPCINSTCRQKWFVLNPALPECPFCKTSVNATIPVLSLYHTDVTLTSYQSEDRRIVVFNNQSIFQWHVRRDITPNEKLSPDMKRRVGYFVFHNEHWYLVNEAIPELYDVGNKVDVQIGGHVILSEGMQLLTSRNADGRLLLIQFLKNSQLKEYENINTSAENRD
jgi:serine/threonine protein kinase